MTIRKEQDGSIHIIVSENEWYIGPGVSITSPAWKAEWDHFCDRLAESVRTYELDPSAWRSLRSEKGCDRA